ncbi:MAG: HD domain-containing phosphohydrolase [Chthoniobacterales bacterium]
MKERVQHPDELGASSLPLSGRGAASLGERISALHENIRRGIPQIDRMACALYDPGMDLLKTFVNSTVGGEPLKAYQYKLSNSPSLVAIKESREPRVIDDIASTLKSDTEHTRWVKSMGYRSSYTVPIYYQGVFEGFLFFDSRELAAFTPEVRQKLDVYVNLILLMIAHELTTVQALVGSVRVARDFTGFRDEETGSHLDRMSRVSRLIARGLVSSHGLTDEFVERIFLFSPLHDIGKIGIPDAVLRKPGSFTPEERKVMESHVGIGAKMVDRLVQDFDLNAVSGIECLRNIVSSHHEFLDGSGYPARAKGAGVPLEARIVAVADIFDALTSKRVYKEAWGIDQALDTLDKMASEGKLDKDCVDALRANKEEARQIIERFGEAVSGEV